LLLIFIGQGCFKGAPMQVEGYHIGSAEGFLWQIGQEQLIDHFAAFDTHPALRRPFGVGRYDNAALLPS
jgi:hypothetical protein